MQLAGKISELRLQVPFHLAVNGHMVCTYTADFVYQDNGKQVIEDVKSPATRRQPTYRVKFKLAKALGINITEV